MTRYAHIDTTPPKAARDAAAAFVASWGDAGADRSVVGHHARAIASGRPVLPATVRWMAGAPGEPFAPDAGAGGAVGGEAGNAWARRVSALLDAADRAATAGDGPHTGVAVVLPIDGATAAFVEMPHGLPARDMHITLAFLGKTDAFTDADRARLAAVVDAWAAETPALPALFSGVGRFVGAPGVGDAVHLTVDAPGLAAAREGLVKMLRAQGFAPSAEHGFDPHATLLYLAPEAPTPTVHFSLPLAVVLDRAALWWGDDRAHAPALSGSADPKALDARTLHGEGVALFFADGEAPTVGHTTENQIARLGTFLGHPQGPVAFTPEVFAQIEKNFAAMRNGEIPGDFEHTSERLPPRAATDGVPAPFWIKGVRTKKGGAELWATFEWVDPKAVEYVRSGQYKYLSPAIKFTAKSRETGLPIGAVLTSVALTNHPFIDGLAPVTASARAEGAAPVEPAALFSPSVDALHAPGFGPRVARPTKPEGTTMTTKKTDAPAEAGAAPADESKTPAAEMSAAPPPAEMRGAVAPPAPAEGAPALAPQSPASVATAPASDAFLRRCCETIGMTDVPGDHEAAENQVIATIAQMVEKLRAIQKAEADRQMEVAAGMSARVIAAGLAPEAAAATLTTMCLSSRETFDMLYPLSTIEAAEKRAADTARAAAEAAAKEAAGAAPGGTLPHTMSGRVDDDAARVLLSRVGAAGAQTGDAATPPRGSETSHEFTQRRTAEIAAERGVDIFTARGLADQECAARYAARGPAVVTPAAPQTPPAQTPATPGAA